MWSYEVYEEKNPQLPQTLDYYHVLTVYKTTAQHLQMKLREKIWYNFAKIGIKL